MRPRLLRGFGVVLLLAILAISGMGTGALSADRPNTKPKPEPSLPNGCKATVTAAEYRPFSKRVWRLILWKRKKPKPTTIQAHRDKLKCAAGTGHRHAMKRRWRKDKKAFYHHRAKKIWIVRVTPFYGCTKLGICKWWAIPVQYVSCESGGDYYPDYGLIYGGAYGIIPSTWANYGGTRYGPTAYDASPKEQDLIAAAIWDDVGSAAWAPFEPPGCG